MTIPEALKLLGELRNLLPEVGFNKYMASVKLGIEALEEVKRSRICPPNGICALLPGETEEAPHG